MKAQSCKKIGKLLEVLKNKFIYTKSNDIIR